MIAMGLAVAAMGKQTTLYNESPIPAVYRYLPVVDLVVNRLDSIDDFDTAVVLDCGDLQRLGVITPLIAQIPMIINIDHHITNTGFGNLQQVDASACATAEIVYHLIKALAIPL